MPMETLTAFHKTSNALTDMGGITFSAHNQTNEHCIESSISDSMCNTASAGHDPPVNIESMNQTHQRYKHELY